VAAPVVPATATLAPLARFVSGLDEAFEKVRLDARRGATAPGPREDISAQAIRALDAALERWSPVITTLGGPAPALVGGLGRIVGEATRAVDAALHALSKEGVHTPPPITAPLSDSTPAIPPERDASPTLAAVASLGLMALTRVLADDHRHRSRTVPSPARPEARARLMGGRNPTLGAAEDGAGGHEEDLVELVDSPLFAAWIRQRGDMVEDRVRVVGRGGGGGCGDGGLGADVPEAVGYPED
jgi:hypothetical protein